MVTGGNGHFPANQLLLEVITIHSTIESALLFTQFYSFICVIVCGLCVAKYVILVFTSSPQSVL